MNMKKIFSYAMLLLCGTLAFTACSDDNDSNPTLVQPTEFSLFQPSVGTAAVDLEKSQSVELSWSLPTFTDFGAPVVPTYIVQISPTGQFTKEYDRDAKDNTGADYIALEQTFNGNVATVNTEAIDQALQMLLGWEKEEDVPATQAVTVRAIASVRDASWYPTLSSTCRLSCGTWSALVLAVQTGAMLPTLWAQASFRCCPLVTKNMTRLPALVSSLTPAS